MKLTLLILLLTPFLLSGCTPLFSNGFRPSSAWHAQGLKEFLNENYPIDTVVMR